MDKEKFNELKKKCFGKEKDDRYHAIAMLILYGIFFLIVFILISTSSSKDVNKTPTPTPEPIVGVYENYTYTYTITSDGNSVTISGKRASNKEILTYVEGETTTEYVVVGNSYYKVVDNEYEKVESINTYSKYLDINKVLELVKDEESILNDNTSIYDISNSKIANMFEDEIINDNNVTNPIFIVKDEKNVKKITLELDNYISSISEDNHTLKLVMEYSDINKTVIKDINVSK